MHVAVNHRGELVGAYMRVLSSRQAGLRAQLLREYGGLEEKEYATVFHDTRMEWMRSDESGWLAESGFYPRVVDGKRSGQPSGPGV